MMATISAGSHLSLLAVIYLPLIPMHHINSQKTMSLSTLSNRLLPRRTSVLLKPELPSLRNASLETKKENPKTQKMYQLEKWKYAA